MIQIKQIEYIPIVSSFHSFLSDLTFTYDQASVSFLDL